jgi:hypothetical protein
MPVVIVTLAANQVNHGLFQHFDPNNWHQFETDTLNWLHAHYAAGGVTAVSVDVAGTQHGHPLGLKFNVTVPHEDPNHTTAIKAALR